jgi:hypothetical protein
VTSPENIANGVRVQKEVTVALKKDIIRMTSPKKCKWHKGSNGGNC